MTQENYIVDVQLPLELDFKSLKAEALAYIQLHSDKEWTNLNPSDPGITILEQLCYAFTELGYCGNFPMKDILTDKNGDLIVDNQFYLPQDILTTAPVTVDDYIKYVIDQVPSVKNVVITPVSINLPFINGMYQVYLLEDSNYDDPSVISDPESETFNVLNSCRNLGEYFLKPQLLIQKIYTINGNLVLKSGYDLITILPEMIQSINNYIFPNVTQTGYDALIVSGEKTNDIFNGPSLKNGWIATDSIQPKKDTIHAFEITKLILEIEGVQSISGISFTPNNGKSTDTATCEIQEILSFDFSKSFVKDASNTSFLVSTKGKELNASLNTTLIDELANMQQSDAQINAVASVQIAPTLPTGKYRDITSYYSIQNTFPEAYAVGLNATNDSTPDYQVAQSRQLKGYLNLFDQMLTNQFAQLANIDKLFSFKNAITGSPSDLETYNNVKTPEEKASPKYPAPFEVFSPTYFYQSLYNSVPNVEPLLRNNSIFNFGPLSETADELATKNWASYQEDPYNSYMYGLLVFSEDDTVNLQRRNDLLDHVLARHGESPLVINTMIYGTVYSGDVLKDQVIIKSVYLQNLQLLSYNRTKAYNSIGAAKLNPIVVEITEKLIETLGKLKSNQSLIDLEVSLANQGETQAQILKAEAVYRAKKELRNILTKAYKKNGIFDTERVNASQKITAQNCLDYDTISLKLNMLLTLQPFYINFIQGVLEMDTSDLQKEALRVLHLQCEMALWLMTERKGMIAIETNVLLQSGTFQLYIQQDTASKTYYQLQATVSYEEFLTLSTALNTMPPDTDMTTYLTNINASYTLTKIESSVVSGATFTPIENTGYAWTASVAWNNTNTMFITDSFLEDALLWIFPKYIPELVASDWKHRLSYFMDSQLPLQISAKALYAKTNDLKTLIPKYVQWYNANIYNAKTQTIDIAEVAQKAATLITTIQTIYNSQTTANA
jgi:hypothetical protein